eukprot:2032780-Pleurochrysis_carterae.AAC.1
MKGESLPAMKVQVGSGKDRAKLWVRAREKAKRGQTSAEHETGGAEIRDARAPVWPECMHPPFANGECPPGTVLLRNPSRARAYTNARTHVKRVCEGARATMAMAAAATVAAAV